MRFIGDRLVNLVTSMGTAKDKTTRTAYFVNEMDPQQAIAAYRSDWIARKIIDIPAFDMIREGRNWQADDAQIEALEAEEARLQVWPKLAKAIRNERLLGGAALILGTGDADPRQPLNVEAVRKGGLKYLHVASRTEITEGTIDQDPASPWWGEPKMWTMTGASGRMVEFHPSRVVAFTGLEVPAIVRSSVWGDSVLQIVDGAVKNAGLTATGIAQLIQEAKVDVYKIPNFLASVGDEAYRERVLTRLRLANTGKSITNALLMDAEEEYEQKTVSFANLPEVLALYLQIAAGAADIPATRLLGQSPAGMSSTGESDLRNYYDRLAGEQEVIIRPRLARLDDVLIPSALGSRPPEVHFAFAPLWQLSETERSTIRKQDAETAKLYVDSSLVPIVALAKSVQNQLVEQGSYPGLETSLDETKATVGLGPELMKTLMAAWQAGGMPLEDVYGRMKAAGLTGFATYEAFQEAIEAEGPALGTVEDPEGEPGETEEAAPALLIPANDAAPRTLYVQRKLLNAADLIAWAKGQGFETTTPADDVHVTIAFSRQRVDWMKAGESWSGNGDGTLTIQPGGARLVEPLGDKGAVVLLFTSSELSWRHEAIKRDAGASWDYPEYQPHVTITYAGSDVDLAKVEPYRGKLVFGPEIFQELDEDWSSKLQEV